MASFICSPKTQKRLPETHNNTRVLSFRTYRLSMDGAISSLQKRQGIQHFSTETGTGTGTGTRTGTEKKVHAKKYLFPFQRAQAWLPAVYKGYPRLYPARVSRRNAGGVLMLTVMTAVVMAVMVSPSRTSGRSLRRPSTHGIC